ncbi:MAG: DUF1326 domain-containing protein [Dehalococcoidia bacterium]|nr:DUF1326 domain-containing protein [Dehalococcoidia bacterium]
MDEATWKISGDMVDACHCPVFCNNLLLREPLLPESGQAIQLPPNTKEEAEARQSGATAVPERPIGRCTSVTVWNIEAGDDGGLPLGGLHVAALVQSPGPLFSSGGWRRALYIDSTASPEQAAALERIFGGDAGGEFRRWKQWTARFLGVQRVPFRSEAIGARRHIVIPGILDLTTEPVLGGRDRQPFQLINPPFWKAPGFNPVVGRSVTFRFQDHGLDWQLSGRSCCGSPFAYQG